MMSGLRFIPIAIAMFCLSAAQAGAQSRGKEFDCSTYPLTRDAAEVSTLQGSACARAIVNRQLLIHSIDVIPRVIFNSFGIGPVNVEPAGLAGLTTDDFAARLAGGSALIIQPTADATPAAATALGWNVWGDGKYTWNDNGPASFDLDGPLWNGLFGIDYKVTSKFSLGIMGSLESSNLQGDGIDLKSHGWGIGPYIGVVLTDNIVFSANVLGSRVDSSQLDELFKFNSDRIQAAASLNGYWYKGTWRFNPGISLSWSKEWMQDDDSVLPDQVIETGLLTPSLQIGDTLRIDDKTTVEPWAGAALDYTFLNRTDTEGFASVDDPYADLRIQAGLNFNFGSNVQLALIGEAGGLLRDQTDSYSAEANLAFQF